MKNQWNEIDEEKKPGWDFFLFPAVATTNSGSVRIELTTTPLKF